MPAPSSSPRPLLLRACWAPAAALALGACGDDASVSPDASLADADTPVADAGARQGCDRVDLLFLIDSSPSMDLEHASLGRALPDFLEVLADYGTPAGAALDYRIAISTVGRDLVYYQDTPVGAPVYYAESGDDGVLRAGCGRERAWVEASDADAAEVLACRADVGLAGPPTEMPMLMVEWATYAQVIDGNNPDFLRADAPLIVVIVTDEDDCSRTDNYFTVPVGGALCDDVQPPERLRDYLDTLKGARDRWAAVVVAGAGDAGCSSKFGDATAAPRLAAFAASSPDNVAFESICRGNMAFALDRVLEVVDAACAAR